MSHSTHSRSFRRRWGDCGIRQDCSRSQSPQCVRCWVVCVRPLLCIIWKALCPYVLDAWLGLWASLEHTFTCVSTTNQATYTTWYYTALWECWWALICLLLACSLSVVCDASATECIAIHTVTFPASPPFDWYHRLLDWYQVILLDETHRCK